MTNTENISTVVKIPRNKLEEYEKVKDGFAKAKAVTLGVGTAATVIMIAIPFDGPFGDIIAALATGAVYGAVAAAEGVYDAFNKKAATEEEQIAKSEEIIQNAEKLHDRIVELKEIKDSIQSRHNQEETDTLGKVA